MQHPEVEYKLILTVHDSIMLEVPYRCVEQVATEVIPYCMTEGARAPGLGFCVKSDVDVCRRWDEKLYYDELSVLGFTDKFCRSMCKKKDKKIPLIAGGFLEN